MQYHRIILTAIEKYGVDQVGAILEPHGASNIQNGYRFWAEAADLQKLATRACEAVYEAICLTDNPAPWRGDAVILAKRRTCLDGEWYTVTTFESDQPCGLPRLTLYTP